MNKKGFTLAEVLAVLTILAILTTITLPIVSKSIKESKDSLYKDQEKIILRSAINWAEANSQILPIDNETDDSLAITLGLLKANGFLTKALTNPKTGYLFPDDMIVRVSYNKDTIEKLDNIKYNGNYKFEFVEDSGSKVELSTDIKTIQLDVCANNNDECISSNLNKIYEGIDDNVTLSYQYNKNEQVEDINLKEYSYKGNIIKSVDMTTYGFYYVYYNQNSLDVNIDDSIKIIIINDTEIPTITFNGYKDEYLVNSEIDLLENVSCSDNSGKCAIKVIGNVNPSIKGKYVITYVVSDDSGNTSRQKQVITIKET